jgi:hypothetical protein
MQATRAAGMTTKQRAAQALFVVFDGSEAAGRVCADWTSKVPAADLVLQSQRRGRRSQTANGA